MNQEESHGGAFLYPEEKYCIGYTHRGSYILAVHIAAVSIPDEGMTSLNLRRICAFDAAEVAGTNVGQLNAMQVSSFCGPRGLVWGYHIARSASLGSHVLFSIEGAEGTVPVYSAEPLVQATQSLFGSLDRPRFPILPGSHTPVAMKDAYLCGSGWVYAIVAIGIVEEDANKHAHILMEDVGSGGAHPGDEQRLREEAAKSVAVVARQQGSRLKDIFVSVRIQEVRDGQTGCALTFLPYIHLAGAAVPDRDIKRLQAVDLASWEESTG